MKKNFILKASVAAVLGGMAVGAQAATFTSPSTTLATEIFGTGSQETLISLPVATYTTAKAGAAATDTYKFTLSGGAVFGEQVTTANFAGTAGAATVVSGGAIGDNTVTVTYAAFLPAAATIDLGTAAKPIKVKNLTGALSTAGGSVSWAAEVAGYSDLVSSNPPTPKVLESKNGVTFTSDMTGSTRGAIFSNNQRYHSINVADLSKKFSQPTTTSFDKNTSVLLLTNGSNVGQLKLEVVAGVKQEAGTAFGFSSGDKVAVTVSGTFPSFQTGNGVYLVNGANCATGDTPSTAGGVGKPLAAASKGANAFTFNIPAADLPAPGTSVTWNVCLKTDGTTEIAETEVTPGSAIDYFNARYIDATKSAQNLDGLKKNGVTQAVPYALSSDNTYKTYLRVQNTGTIDGRVTVKCLRNNGGAPTTGTLVDSLKARQGTLLDAGTVATACGANGASTPTEYSYIYVTGEFDGMDVVQFVNTPNGNVNQFQTNGNDVN